MSETAVGRVVALWRYPVKSMMGEEHNALELTPRGVLGDRAYALIDKETGKVASAKNPKRWPNLFDFRACFVEPPQPDRPLPAVRITLPDGSTLLSTDADVNERLSAALGRNVVLSTTPPPSPKLEEYWPDVETLQLRDTVTDEPIPEGTFFDLAPLHIVTTNCLDSLRRHYPEGRFEVRRFRPNLVVTVENGGEFPEDQWVERTLQVGEQVKLRVTRATPRCVMTTLAQNDLPSDVGILRTIGSVHGGTVGVFAEVVQPGIVRRGDEVRIL